MRILIALVAGGLFGLGLTISDMIDPARVLAFVNVSSGAWDPTLAFVMGGAMLPMAIAWRIIRRMAAPVAGPDFPAPAQSVITTPLLAGAALFGAGWGLVGFCPGPALAAIGLGGWPVWLFVVALIAGSLASSFQGIRQLRPD